jgi:hypothetical protein
MSALFKFSIFLVLALAVGISIYLFGSLSDEDMTTVPAETEAPIAPVDPAAKAGIDDDVTDYLFAQHLGSLEGWRAFLTAQRSKLSAQEWPHCWVAPSRVSSQGRQDTKVNFLPLSLASQRSVTIQA